MPSFLLRKTTKKKPFLKEKNSWERTRSKDDLMKYVRILIETFTVNASENVCALCTTMAITFYTWFIACDWLQNQKLNVQSRHSLTRYKMNQLKLKIRRKNQNPFCLFMYLHLNTYQQCTVHTVNNITFFASLQTVFLSH